MDYKRVDKYARPHTPADVLRLALAKEKSSFEFYEKIIKETKNAALLPVLRRLKKSEEGHIQTIKKMLEK